MRQVAVILTITAMLWHAVVGCCAHHVHAEDACCQSTSGKSAVAQPHHHGCCGHHHAVAKSEEVAADVPAPADSDPESHCSELRCTYVTTSSDDMPSADDCWAQLSYLETTCASCVIAAGDQFDSDHRTDLSPDGAAMRRHLLLGVLRI